MDSLGRRIAHFRKKARISQRILAEAIGMTASALSYYETDKREPNVLILLKMAKVFNITVDALVGLEPKPDLIAQNSDEASMLRVFRRLNGVGQAKALEYASLLSGASQNANLTDK